MNVVRENNIFSCLEYREIYKRITKDGKCLPCSPNHKYKEDWNGWTDFLGVETGKMSAPEMRLRAELDFVLGQSSIKLKNTYDISEIDIYYPDLKLGIEYDGCRWHQGENSLNRDIAKFEKCVDLGITLALVREQSSTYRLPFINSKIDILHFVNKSLLTSIKHLLMRLDAYVIIDTDIKQRIQSYLKTHEYLNPKGFLQLYRIESSNLKYEQAQILVREYGVENLRHYKQCYKQVSPLLPSNPNQFYRYDGWMGWNEFLETCRYKKRKFANYASAKQICLKFEIAGQLEYYKEYKRINLLLNVDEDPLPSTPRKYYLSTGEWTTDGWHDLLNG